REPPAPRDWAVQRPTLRPGFRARETQDGHGQLATRFPLNGQEPGQLRRVEAASGRVRRDPQTSRDGVQTPTIRPSESTAEESTGHRNVEAGAGEATGRR